MELHLHNPDLEAKVARWTAQTGLPADELVEDAIAGYLEGLAEVRDALDSRYDNLKSGRVTPMSGEELRARVQEHIRARTAQAT